MQRKQSMIVFSNGVTQSASGQSRAGAGDRTRHTTVTGENLRQFARQPVLPNFPRGGKLRRNAKGVSSRQSDFVGTVCRAMVVAGSCRRGKRKDHRYGWSFRFGSPQQFRTHHRIFLAYCISCLIAACKRERISITSL